MRVVTITAALIFSVFIWAPLLLDRRLSADAVIFREPSCRNLAEPGRRHRDHLTGKVLCERVLKSRLGAAE
jgi:hypothetical protein